MSIYMFKWWKLKSQYFACDWYLQNNSVARLGFNVCNREEQTQHYASIPYCSNAAEVF